MPCIEVPDFQNGFEGWQIREDEAIEILRRKLQRIRQVYDPRFDNERQQRMKILTNILDHNIWAVGEARGGSQSQQGCWFWSCAAIHHYIAENHRWANNKRRVTGLHRDHVFPKQSLKQILLRAADPAHFEQQQFENFIGNGFNVWLRNACVMCVVTHAEHQILPNLPDWQHVHDRPEIAGMMNASWGRYQVQDQAIGNNSILSAPGANNAELEFPPNQLTHIHPH